MTAHRVVEAVGFPLADCKKIRQHIAGATINDIFMAAVGGALRNYLEGKNELPERSLNAMVPMTTRTTRTPWRPKSDAISRVSAASAAFEVA